MQESASPTDKRYLLCELDHTPLKFGLGTNASPSAREPEASIVAYIREHSGATVTDLYAHVPLLAEKGYNEARSHVIRLLDAGKLKIVGRAPIEQVDCRYERVATCDVCGSPSKGHRIVLWKHNTPVVKCATCGLLYANPRWKRKHLVGRYDPEYWASYEHKVQHIEFDASAGERPWKSHLDNLGPCRDMGRLRHGRILGGGQGTWVGDLRRGAVASRRTAGRA